MMEPMMDRDGNEITVGCKVSEADLGFGDGTVESITVLRTGGGFKVGVHWDEPTLDGPGWSEEGGGRGADHLLVINAAGATNLPPHEYTELELKTANFKRGFTRSPTGSELEMDEQDWDDIVEEDDDDGNGGGKGGEEGGEEEEAFNSVVKVGGRVKISIQTPTGAKWYGGLVGEGEDGSYLIGLDNGDVRAFTKEELQVEVGNQTLTAAAPQLGGIIGSVSGYPMAHSFVKHKIGSSPSVVGLLVGLTTAIVANMPIHHAFKVFPDAFPTPKRVRLRKSNLQDRQGWHSFERGDKVEYHGEDGECEVAAVYGCIYAEPVPDDNEHRKLLVLYDVEAHTFHVGAFAAWRRVPKGSLPKGTTFDCDDDTHAAMITNDRCDVMVASFNTSLKLQAVATRNQAAAAAAAS